MKTLIVFASTYGFTKDCVEELKDQIKGEVKVVNIMKEVVPSIEEFDHIIIGGSIYMGQIQKKLKEYCTQNSQKLMKKNIALFLCCGLPTDVDVVMANAFPEELVKAATIKECFGGELRIEKMKFSHKLITKMMKKATAKDGTPEPAKKPENIRRLAELVNC